MSSLKLGPLLLNKISGFFLIVPIAEQGASTTIVSYFVFLLKLVKSSLIM